MIFNSLVFCHSSLLYLTGSFLLFSNSKDGSTDNSLPALFLNALVHLALRGFFFFLKFFVHFDRQNLKIWHWKEEHDSLFIYSVDFNSVFLVHLIFTRVIIPYVRFPWLSNMKIVKEQNLLTRDRQTPIYILIWIKTAHFRVRQNFIFIGNDLLVFYVTYNTGKRPIQDSDLKIRE